jgi:hypothetical protein
MPTAPTTAADRLTCSVISGDRNGSSFPTKKAVPVGPTDGVHITGTDARFFLFLAIPLSSYRDRRRWPPPSEGKFAILAIFG